METNIYIPELDDADFRRLIDARKVVLILFWAPGINAHKEQDEILSAAQRHPEVAFGQSNVNDHQGLMHRVQVATTPTLQGWVNGSLVETKEGSFDDIIIDKMIANMIKQIPRA